ncbi:MAG: sugar transporter [Parachlamydiales bacterium]|nr:sugar transporter [Parachlamydiales bacterium]
MIFFRKILFCSIIVFWGCSPYQKEELHGAEEFILDSYSIKKDRIADLDPVPLTSDFFIPAQEMISEGDVLSISLLHPKRKDLEAIVEQFNHKEGFVVRNGAIALPHFPLVEVRGCSLQEAQKKIEQTCQKELEEIEIVVSYRKKKPRLVQLIGLSGISQIPLEVNASLFDVLSMAKIAPEANLLKSYVMREGQKLPIDLYRLIYEGDMRYNIIMKEGDKIYLAPPSAASLVVLGEVRMPRVLPMPQGSLSLKEALAQAGGILPSGESSIYVIRGEWKNPKIYKLDWQRILLVKGDSQLLIPGDVIYVGPKPLTEWNRFINQLLPSAAGVEMMRHGIENVGVFVK